MLSFRKLLSLASQLLPASRVRFAAALFILAFGVHAYGATCHAPQAIEAKLKAHPDVATWKTLGNYYGEHSQFDCAADAFRSALRISPRSAELNYLLGLALFQSQRYEEAVAPLRKSVAIDPGKLATRLLLGSSLTKLNQYPDAEEQWRAALRIDPTAEMARHGLSKALLAQGKFQDEMDSLQSAKLDDELAVDLAIADERLDRRDDAIAVITKAMQTSNSVALSSALVTLYVRSARTDEAERVARKAYADHPDDFAAQIAYMKTLVLNGDWTPARSLGKKLLDEKPHDPDVLYANGVLERQDGRYEAARDHLTEAAQSNPRIPNLYYNLGVALARLHNPAGAIQQLRIALTLGDKDPAVHFELANALRATDQADAARDEMTAYQQAIKDQSNYTEAVSKSTEADSDVAKGDLPHAIALYRDALEAYPKYTTAGYKLALALDKSNQTGEERTVLEQVIATDPNLAPAQYQLGYLDSRSGNNGSAEQHFREAIRAAPGYTEAWISLAATLGMESKFPEARQAIDNALRIDPKNSEAAQLSQDLAKAQSQAHN